MLAYFRCLDTDELWFILIDPQALTHLVIASKKQ